jgi:hypothetical protein
MTTKSKMMATVKPTDTDAAISYKTRHNKAINVPHSGGESIVNLIAAWAEYAADHKRRNGDVVGNDGYIGPYWQEMGGAINKFLSGDCGKRLDMGMLDSFMRTTATENGIDGDTL